MPSIKNLKSPKKTFECHVPYWILAVKSTSIKFWYKVLTTHIHKWCQSTFWQNWVKYITEIYGKMWFWKWRIRLSWLIWIKFKICLILWTPLLLVLSAVRFKQWHSKVVLQWINEIEGEKRQAKSNMSGASHYEIARLYNLHHLWLSRPGLKGNTVTYIWC